MYIHKLNCIFFHTYIYVYTYVYKLIVLGSATDSVFVVYIFLTLVYLFMISLVYVFDLVFFFFPEVFWNWLLNLVDHSLLIIYTTTIVIINDDIICDNISRCKYYHFRDDKWSQKEFVFLILLCVHYCQ